MNGQGWVSVKDGLPNKDELVLAYNGASHTFIALHSEAGIFLNQLAGWEVLVTYWHPLPNLPENKGLSGGKI